MDKPIPTREEMEKAQLRWEIEQEIRRRERERMDELIDRELKRREAMDYQVYRERTVVSRNKAKAARRARLKGRHL